MYCVTSYYIYTGLVLGYIDADLCTAHKYLFLGILRDLQDVHSFATLESQTLSNFRQNV